MQFKRASPLRRFFLLTILVAIWQLSSRFVSPIFVPSPRSVLEGFIGLLTNGQLSRGLLYSFSRITAATLLSAIIAVPLGALMHISRTVNDFVSPVAGVLRFIPVTAAYPILTMWFGIDERMKVSFLFLATFTYMLPSVILSLDEIDSNIVEAAQSMGANRFQLMHHICLPMALPSICQTFIMMYGIGWTYIAVCEQTNAKYGLGYIIYTSSARGRTQLVFAAIFVIVAVSVVFDTVSKKIVRKVFDWKFS